MEMLVLVQTIKKLRQLASAEETTQIGVEDEIEKSVTSLVNLQQNETTDREQVKEIEDLVYSIEDVLQTYGVSERTRSSGMLKHFKFLSSSRDGGAAADQEGAKLKIKRMCIKIQQFSLPMHRSLENNQQKRRQYYQCNHEEVPVGLEEEKKLIVGKLLDTSEDSLTIFIWGRSGIGKTTLAHEIYSDKRIDSKFKKLKIRLPEPIDINYPLQLVLELFEGSVKDLSNIPTTTLGKEVNKHLQKRRTLIVLEDVRSIDDWRILSYALKGCIILVTTQSREVAESTTQAVYIHEKRPLTEEYSWKLLEKIVWPQMHPGTEIEPAMAIMGWQMVKLCEGIPGAITKLAKQLAGKSASEWEMVQKSARRYLSQVMDPSYAELSDDQKLYFLYLAHFREDPEIEPEKLSHLWVIEGLISSKDCGSERTFMDLTQEHLMVLAHKRMIDVRQIIEVKSCRLVGLMGDMCLSKAEETDFLKVMDLRISSGDNQPSSSSSKTRRLVIYLGKYDGGVTGDLGRNLWSLRIIRVHDQHQQLEEFVWPSIMSNIKKCESLRILDFGRVDFRRGKLPGVIFALPFLRYLSFQGCFLEELPSSISNLSYLEVLDLRFEDTCNIIIPDVLRRMARLHHLYLPPAFQPQNRKKLRLDGLSELQTLKNFNPKLCEILDLFKLTKLRNLDAKVEKSLEDLKSITDLRMKLDELKKPRWLRSSIEVKNLDCYSETNHQVFRQLLHSGVPPILSFEGYIDPLPPHHLISENLTELVLLSSQLKEDPMATLENLAKLRLLVLDDDAFTGEKMVCSASGFPELKHLQLSSLFFFKEWRVENSAMPRLSHLKIENCEKLEMLPDGSEFLDSLLEFKMRKMPKPFTEKVRKRYDNVKPPPSLILDY